MNTTRHEVFIRSKHRSTEITSLLHAEFCKVYIHNKKYKGKIVLNYTRPSDCINLKRIFFCEELSKTVCNYTCKQVYRERQTGHISKMIYVYLLLLFCFDFQVYFCGFMI